MNKLGNIIGAIGGIGGVISWFVAPSFAAPITAATLAIAHAINAFTKNYANTPNKLDDVLYKASSVIIGTDPTATK